MVELEETFSHAFHGVIKQQRGVKLRLIPYVEVRGESLDMVQLELLRYSVKSTLRNGFLRIQGLQNCQIMTQFYRDPNFLEIMRLFLRGDHLTEYGCYNILEISR